MAIVVPKQELDLDKLLLSGQTFRWSRDSQGWWLAPIGVDGTVIRLLQLGDELRIECRGAEAESLVRSYFHLDISLVGLRDSWSVIDKDLAKTMSGSPGLRIVRQDPCECLFSFLCSSASPIHRIRRSVEGMSRLLGNDLGEWNGVRLYTFPDLAALATVSKEELDRIGLGFRGRYIISTAREVLQRGGRPWLENLRTVDYLEAKSSLVKLTGVGEKVADCVCLFSLDKHQAVPIDVHMARVAQRLFTEYDLPQSVTSKMYAVSSELFRQRYGALAGWAQQYFFFAEIDRRGLWDQEIGKHRPKPSVGGNNRLDVPVSTL